MKAGKHVLTKQTGFTMIEAILSLLILTFMMSVLPLFFKSFTAIERSVSVESDYEWNLFLIQLRNELAEGDEFLITRTRILFVKRNQSVVYEHYGKSIRRLVDGVGHEVVLQNVENVQHVKEGNTIMSKVNFSSGVQEEALFILPFEKE